MLCVPFIEAVQTRTARIACGASATRGQGAGVVTAGREFLSKLPLAQFATSRPHLYQQRLNSATLLLSASFPKRSQSWGLARKVLNIFLRDALYTTYLSEKYGLKRAEANFEIPLDSITARHLRQLAGRGQLPRWLGVKHLTPEASAAYQEFSVELAACHRIARVHLDTYWWGHRGTQAET